MLVFLALLIAFDASAVQAQYPGCDYLQRMQLNTEYYVYSPNYARNYPAGASCRWIAEAPANSKITIDCDPIDLPATQNCGGDRLLISSTGRTDLQDAQRYCGRGTLSLTSVANKMNIVLQAQQNSPGGKFLCSIRALSTATSCDCGWKKSNRIVGGTPTGVNEYPMMAGLFDRTNRNVFCGATIISDRYLVSAAHCVINRGINDFAVLVGDDDLESGTETNSARMYNVEAVLIHERFDTVTYQNDISIIRTAQQIVFSQQVGPACLPFNYQGTTFAGAYVIALGWGTTSFSGPTSNKLLKVQLVIQTNERCAQYYPNRLTGDQVCTYSRDKDTCQNDSGGPLCYEDVNTGRVFLAGVISYSINGCGTTTPGVNTRVTSYVDWIQRNTPDASYCVK